MTAGDIKKYQQQLFPVSRHDFLSPLQSCPISLEMRHNNPPPKAALPVPRLHRGGGLSGGTGWLHSLHHSMPMPGSMQAQAGHGTGGRQHPNALSTRPGSLAWPSGLLPGLLRGAGRMVPCGQRGGLLWCCSPWGIKTTDSYLLLNPVSSDYSSIPYLL